MSLADCIKEVMEAAGGRLTKDQAKELLQAYKESTDGMALKDKFATMDTLLEKARQDMVDGVTLSVLRERATRTRQALMGEQDEAKLLAAPKQGNMPTLKAFIQMFKDKESIVEVARRWPTFKFTTDLDANGGQAAVAFKTPEQLTQAIDKFFQPRASRNLDNLPESVKALVGALDSTNDFIYMAANKVGGYLNWRPTTLFSGRVGLPELVGKFSRDGFIDHVTNYMSDDVDTLHQHGIFRHDDLEERLGQIYDHLVRGDQYSNHGAYADGTGPLVQSFYSKTVNKLSDSVFDLPFKDGASWRQYYQDFNGGDISDSLMGNLGSIGRNIGLVKAFGPVPGEGFNFFMSAAQRAAETEAEKLAIAGNSFESLDHTPMKLARFGQVPETLERFGRKALKAILPTEANPEHWFQVLAGETDRVGDQSWANWGRTVRGFASLPRLLGVGHMAHWNDLPTVFTLLSKIEDNPLTAFAESVGSFAKAYDPSNKYDSDSLHALAASLDVHHGNMLDFYFSGDDSPTSTQRANMFDQLFKYTGLSRLDWVRVKSVNEFLNSHMAAALRGDFTSVRPELKGMMQNVGIGPEDWDNLKTGVRSLDTLGGREHLMPEHITDLETQFKYLRMQNEVNRISVHKPGAMEKAIITRGTRPGTPEGEIMRTIGLFRSFQIAMATRVLPFVNENLGVRGKVTWGVSMMLTFMMRDAIKQTLMGKTPKQYDWSKPQTYAELMAYSGMGGIYGDMLASDMSKFGPTGGAAGVLAGPLVTGPVQESIDLAHSLFSNKTAGQKEQKTLQTGLRMTGLDHVPIASAALNRIWLHSIYEALDPGWMQKHTDGLKSQGQREF